MHIFVNELSFQAQAHDTFEAFSLIKNLIVILRALIPLRDRDPICTSQLIWAKEVCPGLTLNDCLHQLNRDQARLLIITVMKGPYVETLLDDVLDYHECWFYEEDVSSTSLAGAAFFDGMLSSLQNASRFNNNQVLLQYRDNEHSAVTEKLIYNAFDHTNIHILIREINTELLHGITSWDDLWRQRESFFPDLIFCACVELQLRRLEFSAPYVDIVISHLKKMNDYIARVRHERITPNYTEMGLRTSMETEITIHHFGYQRTFLCPDGRERIFGWHSKQRGKNIRIHFYPPNSVTHDFIIGYIGMHLDTHEFHH
jgi:hypothetical protein